MASRKFEKGSESWKLFQDYWKFVQDYAIPEKKDEFWNEVISAGDVLCRKYGNGQYCKDLVMAHINELEGKIRVGTGK